MDRSDPPISPRMTLERRLTVRDKVCLAAFATLEGGAGATILNLSEAGMGLQATSSPIPVPEGSSLSEVRLSINLPATQSSIEARGVVTWSDVNGRAGVRFVNLGEGPRQLLREFLSYNAAAEGGRKSPAATPELKTDKVVAGEQITTSSSKESSSADAAAVAAETAEISDAALQVLVERARALMNGSGAAVALLEEDAMVCRAISGTSVPPVGARLGLGTGISAECVRRRTILRCDDSEQDPGVDRESCRALGIRAIVVVPVMQGTKVLGVLEVVSATPDAFAGFGPSGLQEIIDKILTGRDMPPLEESGENSAPGPDTASSESGDVLHELRLPDSWFIRNRVVLGAVAGTLLGLIILTVSARLRDHTVTTAGATAAVPAAIEASAPAPEFNTSVAKKQTPSALNQLEKMARDGDPEAEFSLGARYATGEQVSQDYSEAVKWFSRSADQGHVVAQAALGACYWAGRGVPQDYVRSYMWSWLAKLGGDEASKYRVAVLRPRMSTAQISQAQQLVQQWLQQHPQRAARFSPTAQLQP